MKNDKDSARGRTPSKSALDGHIIFTFIGDGGSDEGAKANAEALERAIKSRFDFAKDSTADGEDAARRQ